MSRRCHHGSPRHARQLAREQLARDLRRGSIVADRPGADDRLVADRPGADDRLVAEGLPAADAAIRAEGSVPQPSNVVEDVEHDARVAPGRVRPKATTPIPGAGRHPRVAPRIEQRSAWAPAIARPPALSQAPATPLEPRHPESETHAADGIERGATAPQLRRFIKSRAYVPMHELRRRFAINGGEDDVTPIDVERQRVYVGLPPREGGLLGELLRAGDIGYELSLDPIAPIVVGVYPMRPVPRG